MNRLILAAASFFFLTLVVSSPARAADQPRRVKSAAGVVKVWSPSQHLYVKGDVGVSDARLRELERWLTKRAPHWTVVLLQSAEGESFVDAEGTSFEDIAAVQHALGKGLSNRTNFGSLKHPLTGEPDGAIFLLSLEDRNLSYFGSDAQDRRGLGDEHWKGELDAPAISAMRSGGRVLDAVRDTITTIDERMKVAVQRELAEQESRRQQELAEQERLRQQELAERESTRASLRDRLQRMTGELDALAAWQQELFGGAPPPGVPQANPDLAGLRVKVTMTLALLDPAPGPKHQKAPDPKRELPPDPRLDQAKSAYGELRAAIDEARQGLNDYRLAFSRLKQGEEGLLALESHRLKAFATPELAEMHAALEQARPAVLNLTPSHGALLDAVEARRAKAVTFLEETARREQRLGELPGLLEALEKGPRAGLVQQYTADARTALRKAQEAFSRQERSFEEPLRSSEASYQAALALIAQVELEEAARAGFLILATFVTLVVLIIARVRRNLSRRRAVNLHAQWRKAIDEKTQALFGMLERTHLVAGRSREEIQQRYAGLTRERALKLASDVDELFLLSVGASRVLGQAEELLTHKGRWDWVAAQLTTGRFVRVTRLLRDEPIVFHPDDGIELVLRERPTEAQRLIGELASYQPFSLSFEALVEAFNTRAANALAALDALESAPDRARESITALENLAEKVRTTESGAVAMLVPTFDEHVIPSIQALVAKARALLPEDPLAALEGPLAEGQRQGSDTSELLSVLVRGRQEVLQTAERAGKALLAIGLPRQWIDETIDSLTRQANALARELVTRPASEDVKAFAGAVELLERRAAEGDRLVGMAVRAREGLTRVAQAIDTARAELGQALRLAPGSMLREEGRDPSPRIDSGEQSLSEAREALGRGDLEPARTGLDAALARVSEAEDLVNRSREAHARFEPRRQERRTEAQRLAQLLTERQSLVADVTHRYLPSALTLRAGDPVRPNANGTVKDNPREFASHTQRAADLLQAASTAFTEGRLLASADLLGQVQGQQELAAHRLEELTEKVLQLHAADARNLAVLAETDALAAACAKEASDPRVMKSTHNELARARQQVETARAAVGSRPGDPFEAAERLSEAGTTLAKVQRSVEEDRALHARAGKSLKSARTALSEAQKLVRRAAGDGIADSHETTRAIRAVEALRRSLEAANDAYGKPHGDWNQVQKEGDRIETGAVHEAAVLEGELEAAEHAVETFKKAARVVDRADGWSGGYGVTIHGSPGASALAQARRALDQGHYASAVNSAQEAAGLAADAIDRAEREVAARRAEAERRRREEERRRREAEERRREAERAREREREQERERERARESRSSSSSSGSGFSSSSWSRDDDDSSSGSSSGSGFGSSGW